MTACGPVATAWGGDNSCEWAVAFSMGDFEKKEQPATVHDGGTIPAAFPYPVNRPD
jgi:hypothetical protein